MSFSNFTVGSVPTVHVSYHLGEHYNSVRRIEDPCTGAVMPIGHELIPLVQPPATETEDGKRDDTPLTDSSSKK